MSDQETNNRTPINPDEGYPSVHESKQIQKMAPKCWKLFFGKKYILPKHRVEDYNRQDFINYVEWATLIALPQVEHLDDIMRACFCNTAGGLYQGRPTLFLERELGEMLLRTALPLDLIAQDIRWKWPAMRIYLPKGLIALNDQHSLAFLDIGLLEENELRSLPKDIGEELDRMSYAMTGVKGPVKFTHVTFAYPDRAITLSGFLNCIDGLSNTDMTTYAMVKPFKNYTVREIKAMTEHLKSAWDCDGADDVVTGKMEHLAIQVLLFLSAFPEQYSPEKTLRAPSAKGERQIPGLYAARFVGKSQMRPDRSGPHNVAVAPTGRIVAAHWVCGFWRRQPCGPGFKDRRLVWVLPYPTGELRNGEEEDT
jgi:hypothetical protein